MLELAFAYCGNHYQVFSAPSGTSALLQFGIVQPDLILLDIALTEADGWETLRRLRDLSTVPVIVLSAVDEPAITIRSVEGGADYCMTGPWPIRELRARVRSLLRRDAMAESTLRRVQPAAFGIGLSPVPTP